MAIDMFQKRWGTVPLGSARAVTGHPLCPQFGFIFNNGYHELVRKTPVISSGAGVGLWDRGSVKGKTGVLRHHDATNVVDRVNVDALVILPIQTDVTIVLAQDRVGTAGGGGVSWSAEVTNNPAFTTNIYSPFTDNIFYWDWGGQTSGTNRLTASGLTYTDDIFICTSGPRGMEIWQNGILRASNGANPSKGLWGAGTENMCWGKNGFGSTSDRVKFAFTLVYWKQLSFAQIMGIFNDPFAWVDPRL